MLSKKHLCKHILLFKIKWLLSLKTISAVSCFGRKNLMGGSWLMSSFVLGPSLASCSPNVQRDAEFCHKLSFGGSVVGQSLIRGDPY